MVELASREMNVRAEDARFPLASLLGIPVAAVCGVVLAAAVTRTLSVHLGQDQSWLLYAAREILRGVKLNGPDLVETNPPFAVWFHIVPVLLGDLLHITVLYGFCCFWLGIAAATGAWSALLFRRLYRPTLLGFWCFVLVECVVLLLAINGEDLGQREHMTAIFLLPYLVVAAFRIERKAISRMTCCLVGVLAAVAICLKPQQILVGFFIEALVLLSLRRVRDWFDWSWVSLGLGMVLYVCSVRLFAPSYLTEMVPRLEQTYWGFNEPWQGVFHTAKYPLIVWSLGTLLYAVLRKRLKFVTLASVLLAASVGGLIAYLQQHKGWHYQLICFVVFGCMLVGLIGIDLLQQWIGERSVRSSVAVAVARKPFGPALVASAAALVSFAYIARHIDSKPYPEPQKEVLAEIFSAYPRGTSVTFLSVFPWEYPAILEQDKVLGTRYVHLWMLPAIVRSEDPSSHQVKRYLSPATVAELSTLLRTTEAQDIAHWKPTVVVVDRCTLHQFCDSSQKEQFGTLIEWFQIDPQFREQWSNYAFQRTIEGLDVYTRTR
jgi:hypothetical protein